VLLIYLDIDGVLNKRARHPNGYCGTEPECVARFNRILEAVPEALIVVSSAWRYLVLNGSMTPGGLENLLLTHGVDCMGRLFGITEADELRLPESPTAEDYNREGLRERERQLAAHFWEHSPDAALVLDDLPLAIAADRFIRTDGAKGLQDTDVERARELVARWRPRLPAGGAV
jgi:hypothetical protein